MKTDLRPKYFVISTTRGMSLVFVTKEERAAYEAEALTLAEKHRQFIRAKYGIYAPNQGIFVTEEADLGVWDRKDYI